MKRLQQFIDWLTPTSTAGRETCPTPLPARNSTPSAPTAPIAGHPLPQSGHIQRKKVSIQPVNPNELINQSEEHWVENGGLMEGHTISNKAISASGQVVDIDKLETQCHVCHGLDDSSIRSDISHLPICRTCRRTFALPNGTQITVTPNEYRQLMQKYDTWAAYDCKRKGVRK